MMKNQGMQAQFHSYMAFAPDSYFQGGIDALFGSGMVFIYLGKCLYCFGDKQPSLQDFLIADSYKGQGLKKWR
jgi:pectin methylesterase-like acyl-CoA thioesterase